MNETASINAKVSALVTAIFSVQTTANDDDDIRRRNRASVVERAQTTRQRNRENNERQIFSLGFKKYFDKKLQEKKKDLAKTFRRSGLQTPV